MENVSGGSVLMFPATEDCRGMDPIDLEIMASQDEKERMIVDCGGPTAMIHIETTAMYNVLLGRELSPKSRAMIKNLAQMLLSL